LTIVDVYTRESVAIEVGQSLKGEDVVRTLNRMKYEGRVPKFLFCDNALERERKVREKRRSLSIPYGMCLTTTVPPSGFHEQGLSVRP
jgi:putative transposase